MGMQGKRAVVTGAAKGLGQAIAEELARQQATVVVADVDEDAGIAVAQGIVAAGGSAIFHRCDVLDEADIANAIAASIGEFGGFNVMFNNAGIAPEVELHEVTAEQWDRVMDINARGVFFGCKQAVIAMRESGGGAIVNSASALSFTAEPSLPAYTASKHAVLGLTRAVALGYAGDSIRCNCVCPGDMDTPLLQDLLALTPDPAAARLEADAAYPMKRIAAPIEVARAAVFLASDEASFINGAGLAVDGGITAKFY